MISLVTNEDNMAMMSRYPDKFFDLAIVDPPYGININKSMGRRKGNKKSDYAETYWDNCIPDKIYFTELLRVSKNQIIWGGNYFIEHLKNTPSFILWDKGFSEDVSFAQFELAWTSFTSSSKNFDKNPLQKNRFHATQKPIELYYWLLERYAKSGDKILDTHLGSGTHRIAADKLQLDFYGCELDSEIFNEQENRFKIHSAQLSPF